MTKIKNITLDNGLKIYFYNDKKRHTTFFQHITLFGGRTKHFTVDGVQYNIQDGVAHILEHYVVEENSCGNFLKLLGEKQMVTNASTYYDMTKFYFEAIEDLEYGITTLLNGIYSPVFNEERLEKIKKPILQEVRGKSESKFYHSNQETFKNIFKNIDVRSIGGSLEDISKTTLDDVITCYEAFYQPSNQFIVVAGNFDEDKVFNIINDFYKKLDFKKKEVKVIDDNEVDEVNNKYGVVEFPTSEDYLEVNFKINLKKFTIKERLKLDFYISYFLNMFYGPTSKLYNSLVKDKIITTSIQCNDFTFDNYLILSIGSYSSDTKKLEEMIVDTAKNLDNFNEELFELDKKDSILKMILRSENLYNTIIPFVDNIVYFNYPHPDEVSDLNEFNFKDFVEMIKSLDFSNYTVTSIKNKKA